jgi:HEPN domain-containing protein
LKALLVWRGIRFPKIHGIGDLIRILPRDIQPELSPLEQERLTDFAAVTR